MTRDEAVRQVKTYLGDMGVDSPGLGADDWGGIELPEGSVLFEYQAAGTLRASALVYRFARPPSERLRAALVQAGAQADTGGGGVEFVGDGLSLCLSRTYATAVDPDLFQAQIEALYGASRDWEAEVLPACEQAVGE